MCAAPILDHEVEAGARTEPLDGRRTEGDDRRGGDRENRRLSEARIPSAVVSGVARSFQGLSATKKNPE